MMQVFTPQKSAGATYKDSLPIHFRIPISKYLAAYYWKDVAFT